MIDIYVCIKIIVISSFQKPIQPLSQSMTQLSYIRIRQNLGLQMKTALLAELIQAWWHIYALLNQC